MTINSQESTEVQTVVHDWGDYPQFKEYLLALTRGPEFTLEKSQFPEEIDLSAAWYELFQKMRGETAQDGIERWAPIGYKDDKTAIFLPTYSVKGTADEISTQTQVDHERLIKSQFHITNTLGDIHTHPPDPLIARYKLKDESPPRFSIADFYGLVRPQGSDIMILVEGQEQLIALKSRTSRTTPSGFDQKQFGRYWYKQLGVTPLDDIWRTPIHEGQAWKMNAMIAEHHDLVLYRGRLNTGFYKAYPST